MFLAFACWVCYLSIVNLQAPFTYSYGWEWLTCEGGFLAIFLCSPPTFLLRAFGYVNRKVYCVGVEEVGGGVDHNNSSSGRNDSSRRGHGASASISTSGKDGSPTRLAGTKPKTRQTPYQLP